MLLLVILLKLADKLCPLLIKLACTVGIVLPNTASSITSCNHNVRSLAEFRSGTVQWQSQSDAFYFHLTCLKPNNNIGKSQHFVLVINKVSPRQILSYPSW